LLGLPFLRAAAQVIGVTPTVLVMALDVVLLLLAMRSAPALLVRPEYRGVQRFLIWWLVFLLVYSAVSLLLEPSEYSIFTWQYLAVYGSYYALVGLLAVRQKVPLPETMAVGLPLFAFNYWLLDTSFISVSAVADERVGLRGTASFGAIESARIAGLVLLMALAVFLTDRRTLRRLPEIGMAIVLSAPLAWYAYTRQVYVAGVLAAAWMVAALHRRIRGEGVGRRLTLIAIVCVGSMAVALLALELLQSNPQSRIAQSGLQSDRWELWKASLELLASHPITGVGIEEARRNGIVSWPHNWFIESWLSMGLPGLILTAIGGGSVLAALLRRWEPWLNGWLFLGLYFLLVAQVSADIARNSVLFFFIVLAFHAMSSRPAADAVARLGSPRDSVQTA